MAEQGEGDETAADNSVGRLLALSDGVFAIAMTLLALDLRLPELGDADGAEVVAAIAAVVPKLLTFVLSFYVVANYWIAHHGIMRTVTRTHRRLIVHTLGLLAIVAALPFPSSLLAEHISAPISLAVYGGVNVVASLILIRLRHDVRVHRLSDAFPDPAAEQRAALEVWGNLVVFALCIPAGYLFGVGGAWVLLLLVLSGRLGRIVQWRQRVTARP